MEPYDYNIESRVINGSRYYRYRSWDKRGNRKTEICASSYEELARATKEAGYPLKNKVSSQIRCKF